MKKVLFIGAVDISDLLHYVSKVIALSEKRLLLVDATNEMFIKYNTPLPNGDINIVEFEGFDVAFGYESYADIELKLDLEENYDFLIVHTNKADFISKINLTEFDNKYIATSQERISIVKTVEVINSFINENTSDGKSKDKFEFKRIHVNTIEADSANEYLETILESTPILWLEDPHELLNDEIDFTTKINYQHQGKINIRRLSKNYKKVIHKICLETTGFEAKELKLLFNQITRRSFTWGSK